MSGINQRTFTAAIASGFYDLACGETMSTLDSNLTDDQLRVMETEACGLPSFFFREIDGWRNTKRTTLFPKGNAHYPLGLFGRFLLPTPERWTPNINRFLNHTQSVVQGAAREVNLPRDIDTLLNWAPNRVGLNLMRGNLEHEAKIPRQTGHPTETGLVIALELIGSSAGKMTMVFSADVCATLGLERPEHEVASFTDRMSLTLAELQVERPDVIPGDWS